MLFRLVSILCLLAPISVFSSPIQHSLNSTHPKTVPRHLYSQTYSIKIKIPANFSQRLLALIIQNPCSVPTNRFYCEPISSSSQIPIPIRKIYSITPSTDIILEYTGYFENPISLDFTYLNQNYVLEYLYPSLTFSGTPTVTLNPLNVDRTPGSVSSYFYGYIRAQFTANVAIDVRHDDDCVFWLNDVEYVRDEGAGRRTKTGPVISMIKDEYYYFNATLKNSGGSAYGMWLSWNMTGSVTSINTGFLYYPIRFQGTPLALQDLKRNYYCEVVNGLKCQVCDYLCTSCSMGATVGVCQGCVTNASLRSGACYCNPGFSQNTHNLAECIQCPSSCKSCYATSSGAVILCDTCAQNAYLGEDSICYCKEGYYSDPNNQSDCIACPPLCKSCHGTGDDANLVCDSCVSNAELVGTECKCEPGYLQDTRYLNQCTECPDLCETCSTEGSDEICITCEDNAHIESNYCVCDEGFYQDSNDFDKCVECPGICKTCYVDTSKNIICSSCKDNSVLSNGQCACSAGYIISSESYNVCIPCSDSLCDLCSQSDSGVEVCTQCTNHAEIIEGKCECIDKFTEPINNTGSCVSCRGSLCVECKQDDSSETCTQCVENAVVNNNSCECKAGYYESSYSLGTCIACSDKLCDKCYIQGETQVCEKCEMNSELKDGKCVCTSGYIELMSNLGVCTRCNDPLCGKCYEESNNQKCEVCVENGIMVNGECRCETEYVVGSDGTSCVTCNIEFCKLCDKVGCVECLSPRVLSSSGSCICPSDNYTTINNSCILIPFAVRVSSSTNSLTITFSKPPSTPLTSSDYNIEYSISNLSSLLSSSISQLSSTSYIITFSSPYRLETLSSLTITFKDSVTDTISQTLSPKTYTAEVSFYSSSSCISVTSFNNCSSCSGSNASLSSCDRCDSSCRCVSTSWETCTQIVPSIESATWNNDMLAFSMRFNIQILTISFINNDCSQYFTSTSLSQLGNNSICTWNQDLQTLTVSIGINSTLTTGSISLRTNTIPSAYNSNKTYNNSNAEGITLPRQYPNPTAVLNTPSIISDCNDLKADGSQSFGNRRRLSFEWSVAGNNAESISNINNILRSETGNTIIVLNGFLSNLTTISITLTVRNVFGMSHSTTAIVSLSQLFVPEVVFQGGPEIKILTTSTFSPQITLRWPVCKTPPTSYNTEWSLTLISQGKSTSTRRLQASSNRQSFTITPGSLMPDSTYSLNVTVTSLTSSQDALPASASQIITTLPAPMTITITRGNRQTSIYRESVLDGSSSKDPSYPNLALAYSWDCKESNLACDFMNDLKTTSSTLTLPPNTMKPERIYIFTLTVSNSMRSSSASSYLQTTSLYIPEIYLFTYSGYLNPYYIVFANNEVSNVPNIKLQWRISGGPYILNSPSNQRSITVKEGSLTYGLFYTFSLEVSLEDYSTISTISLYVNTPPLYGNLIISPEEGKELETFTFVTSEWEDVENNYPIRYELYKDVNNLMVKVADLNYATVYQGLLSVGYEIYNYSRAYYIRAYDSLGAYSYTAFNVTVSPIMQEEVESIAYSKIEYLNQVKEVIEDLDTIPYTVITLSDSLFRFETIDTNQDSRFKFVEDCLSLLSYYSEQDIESTRQATSVISTLERVTTETQVVNEYSRNETVRMFNTSISQNEGGFKDNSIQQAVQIATNLYLSSDNDSTITNSTKDSNSISYYTLLNNLGLAVVKNNIRNQDYSEFTTDIYKVLYQRVAPSTMNSNFTLPDGQIVFPSSISEELFSQDLSQDSIIDLSFIYSQQNSFTNYSSSFNESLYYIKNAGVMYVDAKYTGYENEVGDVVIQSLETIELSNLTYPIEIYITVEFINITDQTPECVYLNESSMEWENTGCRFKEYLEDMNQIVCECFHMSFYSVADFKRDLVGAAEHNRAEDLNIERLVNAKIEDCYSVVIVMSLIVVIHISLSIYVFKLDIQDGKTPIELIPENEGFKHRKFSKAKTASSNLTNEAKQLNLTQKETPKTDQINYDDDKLPQPLKVIYPIHTEGLYMVYQEVELQPKTFAQFFILNHALLELRYIRNHTLSKISRLSLLFYSIYANIYVLGFFYTLEDEESFKEQVEQIIKAMKFNGQDVILFIYTKLVVLGPLILLKWLLSRDIKILKRSVKNWIGIVLMLIGYIGSILGIIILGVNFQVRDM